MMVRQGRAPPAAQHGRPAFFMAARRLERSAMRVDDFDFDLPRQLIAAHPAEPRDAARLLVIGPTLDDRAIGDLPALLRPGDLLVFNDTRVIPARLVGIRGAARVEVTLHR